MSEAEEDAAVGEAAEILMAHATQEDMETALRNSLKMARRILHLQRVLQRAKAAMPKRTMCPDTLAMCDIINAEIGDDKDDA